MSNDFTFSNKVGSTDTDDAQSGDFWEYMREQEFGQEPADGPITVQFTDEEMERIEEVAEKRNRSYADGRSDNTVYGDSNDSLGIHVRGVKAEMALELLYKEAALDTDEYVYGDDGTDVEMYLDGEMCEVDVKSAKYSPTWCQLKADYAGKADAYVVCYVPEGENKVVIKGWLSNDELCSEENLTESRYGHMNYTQKGDYNPMPQPDSSRGRVE